MRKVILSLLLSFALSLLTASAFAASTPNKDYQNDDLASDAVHLEDQVKQDGSDLVDHPVADLRQSLQDAIGKNNAADAVHWLSGLIAIDSHDWASWLTYSQQLAATSKNDDVQKNATTAAYLAYLYAAAKPDEAKALARVGEMFAIRELWRPSLDAYRISLILADDPAVRDTYTKERQTYGFRILQYKVDKDSASPRVCFQFSENLAPGHVDFAPYVSVADIATPAISTEDQQLCVEGLKHGITYHIILRKGLPSVVHESLLANAEYDVYVRDRSPQVHFTGKNYVLPRVGQEGIPVVSVNTQSIAVTIVRVGDRNLLPTVRSEDFLAQLSNYRLKQFIDSDGKKIWSGTLTVANTLNQDVTTAFPVLEALGTMQPGIYIMTAKAADDKSASSDEDQTATQ